MAQPDLTQCGLRPVANVGAFQPQRDIAPDALPRQQPRILKHHRALVRQPTLLLLDEPFAALDALTRIKMHGLVLDLWRAHRPAVLMVTHDVDEAIALADRVLVLDAGRIAAQERIAIARGDRAELAQPLRQKLLGILGGGAPSSGVIPFPHGGHA